jgi:hypothetical protein
MPLIPLAISLASQFLPSLVSHLAGEKAAGVAQTIADAATTVTGAKTPQEALALLEGNSDKQRDFRLKLAQIAIDLERADQADRQDARALTGRLVAEKTAIAWAAPILSAIILLSFAVMIYCVLARPVEDGNEVAQILLGALASMAMQVTNFWLGSSRSSQEKTAFLTGAKPLAKTR